MGWKMRCNNFCTDLTDQNKPVRVFVGRPGFYLSGGATPTKIRTGIKDALII
jgi:topoisomerase IA-like protein